MTPTQIAVAAIALFTAVAVTSIARISTSLTAQIERALDEPTDQQAMTAEWTAFLDTLPVLKEDPR